MQGYAVFAVFAVFVLFVFSPPRTFHAGHGEFFARRKPAGLLPGSQDPAVPLPRLAKAEQGRCQDAAVLHAGHLADLQQPAAPVAEPSQVDDQVDRRGDLAADGGQGQVHPHQDHGLQTGQHVLRAVGVAG